MNQSNLKLFILSIFLWNAITVFSQKDTLDYIINLDEIEVLTKTKKKRAASILKKTRKNIKYNYPFENGVNYKVVSSFKNFKTNTYLNINLLTSFKNLFSSKIQILKIKSNKKKNYNHLFHIVYANLKWAKKTNGDILSFRENATYYFIETGSKYQSNFYKINKKNFSYEKIIVRRRRLGKKDIVCENSKVTLSFYKKEKLYQPKELHLKCFNDIDTLAITHNLKFTEVLPFKKINNKANDVHRILRLYTDRNVE